jgi:hypothetical protein
MNVTEFCSPPDVKRISVIKFKQMDLLEHNEDQKCAQSFSWKTSGQIKAFGL